jgi:hypothetical protein
VTRCGISEGNSNEEATHKLEDKIKVKAFELVSVKLPYIAV